MSGCQALFDLLMQMQHVVSQAEGVWTYRFDSGPVGAWAWIGFNVNDMEFFFFLSLYNPETVTVQRYGEGIDPESFDGTLGELDHRRNALVYWFHSVDLADPEVGFFEVGRAEQVQVLAEVFETGFRFGQSLQSSTSSPERAETSTGSVDSAEPEVV